MSVADSLLPFPHRRDILYNLNLSYRSITRARKTSIRFHSGSGIMKSSKSIFRNQSKINVIVHLGIFVLGLLALAVVYLIRFFSSR